MEFDSVTHVSESEHGVHIPVLLDEAVDVLRIRPDGVYVDGTFGRGGHSRRILAGLGVNGRLWVFDKDPQAISSARAINDERMKVVAGSFADMAEVLVASGVFSVDGVLLDLGVSSPQFDDAKRGFSFRYDAPLDMRMDNSQGLTAQEWIASADEATIKQVIYDYSEERLAGTIAKAIVAARTDRPISTTRELTSVIRSAVKSGPWQQDSTTRTFQAIRIHINQELTQLSSGLIAAAKLLHVGGRLAVISFHSLEDRIVKRFLRSDSAVKSTRASRFLPPTETVSSWRELAKTMPGSDELRANPRARSAILRSATRC